MSRPLAVLLVLPLLAGAGLPHAQGACGDTYRVVRGDTLYSIARLCGGTVSGIARASGLADARAIEVGQELVIRPGARPAPPPRPPEEGKEEPRRDDPRPGYRMERGDTLYSLARWARVSLRALLAANPGIDPQRIEIGDLVRLPEGAALPHPARLRERRPERGRPEPAPPRPTSPPPPPEDEDKPDEGGEPDISGM
jgi:LysM repeat protein